ncbi:MAG: polynucleotide adenylyltransferase PcnB [Rubrivivax sp.]
MIRRLIDRLLGKQAPGAAAPEPAPVAVTGPVLGQRVEIPPAEHGIDASLLDDHAVRVVRTLKDAGHEAYVVGGAVRDLLVGRRPKDFDVATDATPEQVKALFRRAFIIGRRFRIVHVVFGRGREHEVIEVSTFRALLGSEAAEQVSGNEKTSRAELAGKTHVVDASGRVLRDNVWGPQIEDAARRDFTVNAMYYDPVTRIVVDYHGGLADVRARTLRMIGDPVTRYREDPVRLLRVARFAAKLGFDIERGTLEPIARLAPLLANVPGSRLFDEMVKLLQTGHAIASLEVLQRHGLVTGVFPILEAALSGSATDPVRARFIRLALEDTDRRVSEDRPVAPSFMLACLLWHDVQGRWQALRESGEPAFPALQQAIDAVFDARIGDISGRGKLAADMREIWQMQPRLERRTAGSVASLVEQPRYRAGYDFLRLRADVEEVSSDLADWWEDYALGSDDEREAMLQELKSAQARRPPGGAKAAGRAAGGTRSPDGAGQAEVAGAAQGARPPKSVVRAPGPVASDEALADAIRGDADPTLDGEDGESDEAVEPAVARKRRRRRRRPGPRPADAGAASDA